MNTVKLEREEFIKKHTGYLNEKQLQAVETIEGPVLLLAVPGSGKTTVLVTRLGYMLYVCQIAPENILTLTYTVAATNDMSRRFENFFGGYHAACPEFRTINGICASIIWRYGQRIGKEPFRLITEETGASKILTEILARHLSEYPTESDVKGAAALITYCKNMLLTDDEITEAGEEANIPLLDIYGDYNHYLRSNQLMDYDDQLVYAYRMLKGDPDFLRFYQDRYRYICVDEAQDTSKIQHMIINLLSGTDGNLFLVGDEDQSIYGFRAAYPEALLNFEKNHPKASVLVMDQNYRSNARIVNAADAFIRQNKARHDKHMVAVRDSGAEIHYIELKSRRNQYGYLTRIASDCSTETAVLYRDNECALPLIDRLDRQKMPFRIKSVDMAFFTHRVVTDITNIMRFSLNPKDPDLFMRIYFKCRTYLRKNQAEQLCRVSMQKDIPVLEAAEYVSGINGRVLGNCRGLATNLESMRKESPSKALFRIEKPCGYGEYLQNNNMDTRKLFILKQLSYDEATVQSFLLRLDYLQEMLKNCRPDYDCPFILSTIHSSKGLEYDRVYLMDICDGVFPAQTEGAKKTASLQERKELEEERRLFYVGMTRAKNMLSIFKLGDCESLFLTELVLPKAGRRKQAERVYRKSQADALIRRSGMGVFGNQTMKKDLVSNFDLIIGERIVSGKYGPGTIADVEYEKQTASGRNGKFSVLFDSGEEKHFKFPDAFESSMKLENGETIEIKYV